MCTFNGLAIEAKHSITNSHLMCTFDSLTVECVLSTTVVIECVHEPTNINKKLIMYEI